MERTLLPRRHHVQRFGSALNLNPHSHVLMLDVVSASDKKGAAPVFVPAPPLRDTDVQQIVETAAHRLLRLLQQRGVLDETDGDLPLGHPGRKLRRYKVPRNLGEYWAPALNT